MISRSITVRRLTPDDARALIALRLEVALTDEVAMGASIEEERARPLQSFLDHLAPDSASALFGAFSNAKLIAAAGVHQSTKLQSSAHKAAIWGVVVSNSRRRQGLGRAVADAAIAHAYSFGVHRVNLTVYLPNEPAVRLYASMGFTTYGTEPQALLLGGHFYDAQLMSKARNEA